MSKPLKKMNKKAIATFEVASAGGVSEEQLLEILASKYGRTYQEYDDAENIKVTVVSYDPAWEFYYTREFGEYPFTRGELKFNKNNITLNTKKLY